MEFEIDDGKKPDFRKMNENIIWFSEIIHQILIENLSVTKNHLNKY